jgi:hypothetical protein
MSKVQRKTSTYPEVIEAAKRDYELHGLGYRLLAKKHGIPRSTVAFVANSQKWVKPGPRPPGFPKGCLAARDVEAALLSEGLRHRLGGAEELASPAMKRPRGRPRKHPKPETNPYEPVQSPAVPQDEPLVCDARSSDTPIETDEVIAGRGNQQSPPLRRVPDPVRRKGEGGKTATIIDFPGLLPAARQQPGAVQLLPGATHNDKARARVTLAAIRAMMSLEQVEQLERHEAVLDRYSHLLEVYLEPQRFLDLEGLNEDEKATKIVATRNLALAILLPTEKDTLVGVIKSLTNAIQQMVTLKRKIVGLDRLKDSQGISPFTPLGDEEGDRPRGNLSSMCTADLRTVQHAMELLDRHQHAAREAPMPPLPDPIDDL